MELNFADNFGVGDFVSAVGGDVLVVDDEEGIGAKNGLTYAIGAGSNALTQVTKLFGVRLVTCVCVLGVLEELEVLE